MGTESIIRKAAPWLVRKKQSHLAPLEGTDISLKLSEKKRTIISPLTKSQKKESKKWRDSLSCVRRFFGRRAATSPGHSGDAQNIAVDLEDTRDSEGGDSSPPVSSPRVPNLPAPQSTQAGQSLHFNEGEDPAVHRREMKLAALEQAQIQEELWEAARLRGGCVPCSKGHVALASRQNSDPGLPITGNTSSGPPQVAELGGSLRSQFHTAQPRSRAESRIPQELGPTSAGLQTRRGSLTTEEGGSPPLGQPSQRDMRSRTTSQADSRPGKPSQRGHPPQRGKSSATVPFPLIIPSDS